MLRKSFAVLAIVLLVPLAVAAQTPEEIQKQIEENNSQIAQLDREIAQYEAQLGATQEQKDTLQNKINELNLQNKKLTAQMNVTRSQINTTQLQIHELSGGIQQKEATIEDELSGLADSLRLLHDAEQQPLAMTLLSADSVTDAWQDADALAAIQSAVQQKIRQLIADKQALAASKSDAEIKKTQLEDQQSKLATQQGSLAATKRAQNELLEETKSKESTYQAIIAQKKAQQASFEDALNNLKLQLQVAVNPSDVPNAASGVLQWPVDDVRITQYFGNTPFAASGAYNGKGHNGMDFGVPIGTPIRAALSGVILGTGNTDLVHDRKGNQCYSFGKWVMIKHANGLSTMYAHLSQINVSQGDAVQTGQVIGYSGETGYATGPHLHFGVYLTSVTKIMKLGDATKAATPCAGATMPVPPVEGYLNPLNYLPN